MIRTAIDPQLQKTRDDIAGFVSDMVSKIQQIFARGPELSHAQKTQAIVPLITDGQKNIDKALADSAAWQKLTLTAPTAPATPAAPQLTINTGTGNALASVKPGLSKRALKGGDGEGVDRSLLNERQMEMGKIVEMEHTDDPEEAADITVDHLAGQLKDEGKSKEEQDYYDDLIEFVDPEHKDELKQYICPRRKEDNAKDMPNPIRKNIDYGERDTYLSKRMKVKR